MVGGTNDEQPIVIFKAVNFVKEERAVLVVDESICEEET